MANFFFVPFRCNPADFHLISLLNWTSNSPCNLCNSKRQPKLSAALIWGFFFAFFAGIVAFALFLTDFAIFCDPPQNSYLCLSFIAASCKIRFLRINAIAKHYKQDFGKNTVIKRFRFYRLDADTTILVHNWTDPSIGEISCDC